MCKKFFKRNSAESNLYSKVENYLKKKISLEEIIKKIYEVDKLKFTLFNEDLLNMFSCIPNPSFISNDKFAEALNDNFYANLNVNNKLIKIENTELIKFANLKNFNFLKNVNNLNSNYNNFNNNNYFNNGLIDRENISFSNNNNNSIVNKINNKSSADNIRH